MQYSYKLLLSVISSIANLLRSNKNDRGGNSRDLRRLPVDMSLAVVAFIIGVSCMHFYYRHDYHYSEDDTPLKLVHHKVFENQVVPLDGRRYVACLFRNITIEYNGAGPFELESNRFEGSLSLTSKNKSIGAAVALLKGLGIANGRIFDIETGEELRNVEPPKFSPRFRQTEQP